MTIRPTSTAGALLREFGTPEAALAYVDTERAAAIESRNHWLRDHLDIAARDLREAVTEQRRAGVQPAKEAAKC